MAFDSKRSVYEIAIEIGGKIKDTLRRAAGATKKELDGLEAHASKMDKLIGGIGKFVTAGIVVNTLKNVATSAIDAASEMESYRATLNTVLKDEERAAEMMEWATDFASHTPFSTGDIVDAVTRLEAYGFKSQTMMENIGNMASAMNKDLPTAVEAVYKATLGEMELMENNFAITKKLIGEKSQEWYGQAAVTAQGAIANAELYNNTLLRLIEEKFEGGMERQSKTYVGITSNMEDSKDAILRKIIGMNASGEATENGAYGKFLSFLSGTSEKMAEFADSETLTEWADSLSDIVDRVLPKIEKLIANSPKATETILKLLEGGANFFLGLGNLVEGIDKLVERITGTGLFEHISNFFSAGGAGLSAAGLILQEPGVLFKNAENYTAEEEKVSKEVGAFVESAMRTIFGLEKNESVDKYIADNGMDLFWFSERITRWLNPEAVKSIWGDLTKTKDWSYLKTEATSANHGSSTSNQVNVTVTVAPDASATEIGKTVGEAVLDAINEANHQAERRRMRPQTAR